MRTCRTTILHRRTWNRAASWLFALASLCLTRIAPAEPLELSRARVAALAKAAPGARAAEAEVGVSRAALAASDVASLENPVLSGLGGVRFNPDGSRPFAGAATLAWPVDTGGKRGSRRDAAAAEHRQAQATAEAQHRRLLLAALLQHAAVLRDERQLGIAEARKANSERVVESARKRREAGSVTPLDLSLATLQLRRDTAATATATGERDAAVLRLRALLGLSGSEPASVSGELVPDGEPPPLEALLRQVDRRADVREATARVGSARARASRESSAGAPTINLLAQYERDDAANIGMLGVAVPLPVLNANRLGRATSHAEVHAARAREDAVRALAVAEVRELYARYEATKRAREALAPAATSAGEPLALATRAYELGEGDLAGVLLVHREVLDAQRAWLEAEYAHAAAKLELFVASGRTPQ